MASKVSPFTRIFSLSDTGSIVPSSSSLTATRNGSMTEKDSDFARSSRISPARLSRAVLLKRQCFVEEGGQFGQMLFHQAGRG